MQDMPAILAASKDAGAKWVVVEQDEPAPGQTREQSARLGIEYLKSISW
jgi:sugar phosphate isomerase/epimerase